MENLWTEYKRETPSYKKLHKELSAFSNTEGGSLYIGIDDNGNFFATPKKTIEQIYLGLSSYSDDYLKTQINILWKIEKHPWKENKDQIVYKFKAKISEKPIATIIQGETRYYTRIDSFIKEVDFESISAAKDELTPSNMAFDINSYKDLIKRKKEFEHNHYQLSYKLVNEKGKATILGLYLSDFPPTNIKYKDAGEQEKNIKIVNIQDLFNSLSEDFEKLNYYGVYYIPYLEMIKKIKEVSRELIVNAIAHGDLAKEIKIEFKDGVFSVQNFWPNLEEANNFFLSIRKNKIKHSSFYPIRNRLLKELKMIETSSRGYNEIISKKEDYWIVFQKNRKIIKISIIPKLIKNREEIEKNLNKDWKEVLIWA